MAGQKLPNLKRGSDGVFRYRRVVPRPYRDFFGKSEHKKVLTADPTLARQLWEKEERWFDQTLSKAKATAKEQDGSFSDVNEQARQFLAREGLLDDQMPKLSPNANAQERQEYLADVAVWQDRRELYQDLLLEALEFQSLDEEQLKKDYDSGADSSYFKGKRQRSYGQDLLRLFRNNILRLAMGNSPHKWEKLTLTMEMSRDAEG